MKKKKETPNPTPDTGKGPPRCSKRWRQNEPLSRPARSPTSASGGAQGRKLSPPGTVVDVQQNVAAQRGGSENAKESPHLKQGEAEPAESQARPGGWGPRSTPTSHPEPHTRHRKQPPTLWELRSRRSQRKVCSLQSRAGTVKC